MKKLEVEMADMFANEFLLQPHCYKDFQKTKFSKVVCL